MGSRAPWLQDGIMRAVGSMQGLVSHSRVVGDHAEFEDRRWVAAATCEVRHSSLGSGFWSDFEV